MNYNIITDEFMLRNFIEWLPETADHEKFYCCLFSRKKYTDADIKASDKTQLKRFLATKEQLFDKIRQLEAPIGAYRLKEIEAPQESLALYINPNPRDLRKATFDLIIELTSQLKKGETRLNPHSEALSCIQRSSGKKTWLDFDVDTKDFDFERLFEVINKNCLRIVETRGGYHVLVEVAKIAPAYKRSFYNNIKALGVDQTGDQLLPVPGCTQGGFTPRFLDI